MADRIPAETFPPGEFIREELAERGWTQDDLAKILGRAPRTISEIVNGKRAITPKTAKLLACALGTSADVWMGLQAAYQLAHVRTDSEDSIRRRAEIYGKVPLKEMIRRGWIEESGSVDVLEKQVCSFLEIDNIEREPVFEAAARKSTPYGEATSAQTAWLWRARNLARAVHAKRFDADRFRNTVSDIRALASHPEDVRRVPGALAEMGVRFLVVQHLPGTKIDGACFWLSPEEPAIVLSLRYDRIDWFWFTLGHEAGHVCDGSGPFRIDSDLDQRGADKAAEEERANEFAARLLVDQDELDHFIKRFKPLYSRKKIDGFARRIGIHPGIVVGQLHYRKEIPPRNLRKLLVPIREVLIDSALTDGWGRMPPPSGGAAPASC